ncbi:TonB-dependent hemoglobin/transferrin/lactoferrin family receptor [Pseudoxanthomonas koreensis]|uniref:TonB-dependent hemoglobin/transferrin/lactoferrin family receptor n=1 Tax=Pseudoxanthomonas koreensis TaxID=266061 RepID=UPI001391487D|nr:TonB-dependent hemoglobin/transferrin/lactoferrin family receptor [Pseudoxanthomonas koreensis]
MAAAAEVVGEADRTTTLDTVVVVSSRAPEPISQVVASVSKIEREELDRRLVRDPASLVRYVPGVAVVADGHRWGARGFSIRGLEGNRVRILVDGIPLADDYSIGQFASAGRDLVDLEAVERVEVQRGPASTLYGSDALAGVVAFRTLDPEALLARKGGNRYLGVRLGYDDIDDSRLLSASWAGESAEGWQAMAMAAERRGHEAGNRAWRAEDAPNPTDYYRRGMLAKLAHGDAAAGGRYTLALEASDASRQTEVNSLRFGSGRFNTTYRLGADDRQRRARASLAGAWPLARAWMQDLEAQLYWQGTDIRQDSEQYRLPDRVTPFESLRWRRFDYAADAAGISLLAQARHEGARARHWHVYGLDLASTRYEGLRDGLETNLRTGQTSTTILGEQLPVRDFPNTDADSAALFWQDEIGLGERFAVVPGLRAEWNRLRAHPDAVYLEDYPDNPPVDVETRQATPRLALRWMFGNGHSVFVQYARGFRAPPFGDVNIGLSLPVYNYEVRANPDLRPEHSQGLELGWRYVGGQVRASAALYDNRYRDLIESRANLGIDPGTGSLVFQSVNRDRARIHGIEAELLWQLPVAAASAGDWQVRRAVAWSGGEDPRRDLPLNTVDPPRATLGLSYDDGGGRWGGEGVLVAVQGKQRIDHSTGELFAPPGYARFDLYGWFEPRPGVRVNAALLNLADRRYWEWAGVRGVTADDDGIGFHTQPGRSFAVNLTLEW